MIMKEGSQRCFSSLVLKWFFLLSSSYSLPEKSCLLFQMIFNTKEKEEEGKGGWGKFSLLVSISRGLLSMFDLETELT